MVAATAAKIGTKCLVIQESWVPHDEEVNDRVCNILLARPSVRTVVWLMKILKTEFERAGKMDCNPCVTVAAYPRPLWQVLM